MYKITDIMKIPRYQDFTGPDGREYVWEVYPEVCQVRIIYTRL